MGFLGGVFQNGDPEKDGDTPQDHTGRGDDRIRQAELVHVHGALVLAAADGEHLADAGLHLPPEGRVQLDPVDQDQVIRLQDIPRDEHLGAGGKMAEGDDIHGGADRHPAGSLGDAQVFEHLPLPLGSGAAVGTHGRDDKGVQPHFLEG